MCSNSILILPGIGRRPVKIWAGDITSKSSTASTSSFHRQTLAYPHVLQLSTSTSRNRARPGTNSCGRAHLKVIDSVEKVIWQTDFSISARAPIQYPYFPESGDGWYKSRRASSPQGHRQRRQGYSAPPLCEIRSFRKQTLAYPHALQLGTTCSCNRATPDTNPGGRAHLKVVDSVEKFIWQTDFSISARAPIRYQLCPESGDAWHKSGRASSPQSHRQR